MYDCTMTQDAVMILFVDDETTLNWPQQKKDFFFSSKDFVKLVEEWMKFKGKSILNVLLNNFLCLFITNWTDCK